MNNLTNNGLNLTTMNHDGGDTTDCFYSPVKERKRSRREEEEESEAATGDVSKQLTWITRTLRTVASNTAEIPKIARSVEPLEQANEVNQKKIAKLEEAVDYLMKGGQRNLVLHGVAEEEGEDTKTVAEKFLMEKLGGIKAELEFARRLGRENASANRMILLKLKNLDQRNDILANRNKLFDLNKRLGTAYFINEDLPRSERLEQARLRKVFKDIKSKDPDARMKGKRIFTKGKMCQLDEEGQQRWNDLS